MCYYVCVLVIVRIKIITIYFSSNSISRPNLSHFSIPCFILCKLFYDGNCNIIAIYIVFSLNERIYIYNYELFSLFFNCAIIVDKNIVNNNHII